MPRMCARYWLITPPWQTATTFSPECVAIMRSNAAITRFRNSPGSSWPSSHSPRINLSQRGSLVPRNSSIGTYSLELRSNSLMSSSTVGWIPSSFTSGAAVSWARRNGLTYTAVMRSVARYAAIFAACTWPSGASSGSAMPSLSSRRTGKPWRTSRSSTR